MIFADKIIRLRKKNGWSQEELAEKMDVSRQSVSKWEGALSVPDLQKMLQLSELFGVTTDYLLKDEMENEEFTDENSDSGVKRVTLSDANDYLAQRKVAAKQIALATFLCILAPIPLILLGGATEVGFSENLASALGLIFLFVLVAIAVGIYIYCGFKNSPYEFLDNEPFETEYGVKGMVKERQKAYRQTYAKANIIATCICVLSPVILLTGAFTENGLFIIAMLGAMMLTVAVGVVIYILVGVQWASMQRLLQDPNYYAPGKYYSKKNKNSKIAGSVSTIYWLLAVAIFLGYSLMTNNWDKSWVFWPVVGVLYVVVIIACNLIISKDDE